MKRNVILILLMIIFSLSACNKEADKKIIPENEIAAAPPAVSENIPTEPVRTITPISLEDIEDKYFSDFLESINGNGVNPSASDIELAVYENPFEGNEPDESGKVMIIMFHGFVPEYVEGGDKKITTTLPAFRSLLERLYNEGYRTASLSSFINGEMSVQKGCKPIIFTFDDGRESQFSFKKNEDGSIAENPNTAVAVMEQFYNEYPEFGLNGTFFLNLGFSGTFGNVGTMEERLQAMVNKGLELANHTYDHENLAILTTKEQVEYQIGKNAQMLYEIIPEYKMYTLALPYGNTNKQLAEYIAKGEYEGFEYENKGIMLVGAEPAMQMYMKDADPIRIRRVLAGGIEPVDCDMGWWLQNMGGTREYVSDGNSNTITVPSDRLELIDEEKVKALGKTLVVLESENHEDSLDEQ